MTETILRGTKENIQEEELNHKLFVTARQKLKS